MSICQSYLPEETKVHGMTLGVLPVDPLDDWLEEDTWGFRRWHIILMFSSGFLSIVVCICCCCRFRVPRTKEEIEADYIRKKLTRKFKKQLKMLQNSEMDEMDFKKALDRIRTEFISDTESLMHSDQCSNGSQLGSAQHTYRKASDIELEVGAMQMESQKSGLRKRFSTLLSSVNIFKQEKPTDTSRV